MWLLFLIGAIICTPIPTNALQCYTCTYTSDAKEEECLNPADVPGTVTDCDKKYCLSIRSEFIETKDSIKYITRTCSDTFIFKNRVTLDPYFRTHYIACESDLCNGGSGRVSDAGRDPDDGDEILLIVPGIQNGNNLKVSYYLLSLILVRNIFNYIV